MAEQTIGGFHADLLARKVTVRAAAERYLERIERLDRKGPALNSIIELNPDALSIADALDRELAEKGPRGPLHGAPVLIKDNIDTGDQMVTSAGSQALASNRAREDAFLVGRLREAGALILGKTNLSEWANFRSTHSTSGWSSRGGLTKNPYALDRNPSGSSSGSAVAVAADLCLVAVGTETNGSIVAPAARNGIVGLKPTVGLVSRSGIIPISRSQDTAGPMTRTVAEAAVLLGAIVGSDPRDPATRLVRPGQYSTTVGQDGLKGRRIGVARDFFGFDDRVDKIVESGIEALQHLGAELIDPVKTPTAMELRDIQLEVLSFEFKAGLNRYLSGVRSGAGVRSLRQLIAFNEANREQTMPFFGQERLKEAEEKPGLTSEKYLVALHTCRLLAREQGIDAALREHRLDALVAPSGSPAGLTDLVNGDSRGIGGGPANLAAIAGYPHITVPAGHVFGLPVGIWFFGGAFQEAKLLEIALAFEDETRARRPPRFLPTVELEGEAVSGAAREEMAL